MNNKTQEIRGGSSKAALRTVNVHMDPRTSADRERRFGENKKAGKDREQKLR